MHPGGVLDVSDLLRDGGVALPLFDLSSSSAVRVLLAGYGETWKRRCCRYSRVCQSMNPSAITTEPGSTESAEVTRWPGTPGDRVERFIPLFVFIVCLAYLCIPLRYSSLEPDEGIVLQGAERVLHGQVPYRGFFT